MCEVGSDQPGFIKFKYVLPADNRRKGYLIKIKEGEYPKDENDGVTVYDDQNVTRNAVSFTYSKTGYTDGTTYYVRIFTYTYKNADIVYTYKNAAQCTVTPIQTKGYVVMDVSGEYAIPDNVKKIDVFLVGGGSGGCSERGGNGGFTKTIKNIDVSNVSAITAVIGAGGNAEQSGGDTKVIIGEKIYTANGGMVSSTASNKGGSGGGGSSENEGGGEAYAGDGGSDGSNGKSGEGGKANYSAGSGQLYTTKEFGEEDGTLYAAGGAGRVYVSSNTGWFTYHPAKGGEGGGGDGEVIAYRNQDSTYEEKKYATQGVDGTGSGGGAGGYKRSARGASGVAIMRWGY